MAIIITMVHFGQTTTKRTSQIRMYPMATDAAVSPWITLKIRELRSNVSVILNSMRTSPAGRVGKSGEWGSAEPDGSDIDVVAQQKYTYANCAPMPRLTNVNAQLASSRLIVCGILGLSSKEEQSANTAKGKSNRRTTISKSRSHFIAQIKISSLSKQSQGGRQRDLQCVARCRSSRRSCSDRCFLLASSGRAALSQL